MFRVIPKLVVKLDTSFEEKPVSFLSNFFYIQHLWVTLIILYGIYHSRIFYSILQNQGIYLDYINHLFLGVILGMQGDSPAL